MSKGTAKLITNIKPLAGGVAIAQLQIGDYAFGTAGATDLTGFSHFYRKSGLKIELNTPCKSTLSGLIITNEQEPPVNPPPVEPPVTETFPAYFILEDPNGKRGRFDFTGIV
jgi:hypothetical protein